MEAIYAQLAALARRYGAQKKVEQYCQALSKLEEAVQIYEKTSQDELYRDGLIQRFEFTVELAWKSIKEFLEDQGMLISITAPRGVLKEGYAAGVIQDAGAWNAIITSRNITSHMYDKETAESVARQICYDFLPALQALALFYRQ